MRVIQPSFQLSTPYSAGLTRADGVRMLRFIEEQARISHRSEGKQGLDTWERFITAHVIQHGDWSVTEHASITATIRTDRGTTHELVRHRLFAYTQESTRFVRYKNELEFIAPEYEKPSLFRYSWESQMGDIEKTYFDMLGWGAKPQEARAVLPNSLAASIAVTGNLRSWRHFFLMRTSKETNADFKRFSIPMLLEFQKVIPLLYDDIQAESRQVDNLGKPR